MRLHGVHGGWEVALLALSFHQEAKRMLSDCCFEIETQGIMDRDGLCRDDGAGVVDPEVLEAAARQRFGAVAVEDLAEGLRRRVLGSAKIQRYGWKDMRRTRAK